MGIITKVKTGLFMGLGFAKGVFVVVAISGAYMFYLYLFYLLYLM